MACEHLSFTSKVGVTRLTNGKGVVTKYSAEVAIRCEDCGIDFVFVGLPWGVSTSAPCASPDGQEARLPIAPLGTVDTFITEIARVQRGDNKAN